ncbi:histidine kinase [Flavobacterium sp. RHBU_3]|uniref:tetratricopeptide repeat-containing sensor histidine kinase n=1 Tax=Flavobacterium sp. RHBU_3 TaxID=3391184 RepID=UPI0039853F3F
MYRPILRLFLLLTALLAAPLLQAQEAKKETPAEIKKAAGNLEKALIENDDYKIAHNYELLAQEFADKDDLPQAGKNLLKALDIYTRAKDADRRARVLRSIAKIQERQKQWGPALQSYKSAAESATGNALKTLNNNDYNRLRSRGNLVIEARYLDHNIQLLKKGNNKREVTDAYVQLALLNLKQADSSNALEQYRRALPYAANLPGREFKIYGEIAKLYVSGKRYDEAVQIVKRLLAKAAAVNDTDTQVAQQQYLAGIYFETGDTDNAVSTLKEAYRLAEANGKTFDARESLLKLADYYKSNGADTTSLALYEGFLKNLDRIILSDKSLTDAKTFKVTEERIRTLENEKKLKDELISRKNLFSYFLLVATVVLLFLLGFIVKALRSIKTKNKEIALQSLRLEMNPHFLFNSLNSVNQFIAQNNELAANKYLTSYSNLMRNTMENSNKDFITLANETENLTKYLELEYLRFKDKFAFEIHVDEKLDPDAVWVPNMVLQPHLENAIWHGLRYRETKGLLKLAFSLEGKNVRITIDDNGIGITKSNELKTHNQKAHQSRGMNNTGERMTLLNELYKMNMTFSVDEKLPPESGTVVTVTIPLIHKPQ